MSNDVMGVLSLDFGPAAISRKDRPMRWERLFDDLEAQLVADGRRELDAEVADRTRRERALLGLHERLTATIGGRAISVRVAGVGVVTGRAKFVRPEFVEKVKQSEHWQHQSLVQNLLAEGAEIWS